MKVLAEALPAGSSFLVFARRTDQNDVYSRLAEIDSRGQFVIENLAPGEHEIGVVPIPPDGVKLRPEIRQRFSLVKEKVFVGSDNQRPVTLVIDLGRKGDR